VTAPGSQGTNTEQGLVVGATRIFNGAPNGLLACDSTGTILALAAGTAFLGWTIPNPNNWNDPGVAGEISYDANGNFYLCYANNEWAKFSGLLIWNNTSSFVFDFSNYTTYSQYIPLLVGFG